MGHMSSDRGDKVEQHTCGFWTTVVRPAHEMEMLNHPCLVTLQGQGEEMRFMRSLELTSVHSMKLVVHRMQSEF